MIKLIYIDVSSNHPPQIKKQLRKIISDRLSWNFSNKDLFNNTKLEYEEALQKCGHIAKLTNTISNLLKTNFMPTVLPSQVMYGKWKKRKNVTPALTWEVLWTVKTYSNIAKRCSLCLHEKLVIITYPYLNELLNRQSELVTKCRHENKFLLKNFNSNDWSFKPHDNLRKYNINNILNEFILLAFSAWVIRHEQKRISSN